MKETNVSYKKSDKRMEGLRALARMIAAAHIRRLQDTERAQDGVNSVQMCKETNGSPPEAKTERRRD